MLWISESVASNLTCGYGQVSFRDHHLGFITKIFPIARRQGKRRGLKQMPTKTTDELWTSTATNGTLFHSTLVGIRHGSTSTKPVDMSESCQNVSRTLPKRGLFLKSVKDALL